MMMNDYNNQEYREKVLALANEFLINTWAVYLEVGQLGNVSLLSGPDYLAAALMRASAVTNINLDTLAVFKKRLSESIELSAKNYPGYPIELSVEYRPDHVLDECARFAKVDPLAFPLKTFTTFYFNEATKPQLLIRNPDGKRYQFMIDEFANLGEAKEV